MKKIALIIPYFGKFNNYFPFWLESAKANSSIDFLIFTDQPLMGGGNIKVFKSSLEQINALFFKKLKENIDLDLCKQITGGIVHPYKLCDFRPLYGMIFEDYLSCYDFWGHCDVDLIFGQIRTFISEEILDKYDRILSRGHLTLYRNEKDVNLFFLKSLGNNIACPDFITVINSPKNFSFDEWLGMSSLWKAHLEDKFFDEIMFDDICVFKKQFLSYQKMKKIDKERSNFVFSYVNGELKRIFIENNELKFEQTLYAHFQKRFMDVCVDNTSKYMIVPNKFIKYSEPNIEFLKKYGKSYLIYPHFIKLRIKNLLKKVRLKFSR